MKHTPWPWKIECTDGAADLDVIGANNDWIGTIYSGIDADEANARLIVSAPELLYACKQARSQKGDWLAILDIAIAKAEGE